MPLFFSVGQQGALKAVARGLEEGESVCLHFWTICT